MSDAFILLLGAGGHARSCIDAIEQEGRFRVAGLVGADAETGGTVLGYPILGNDGELPSLLRRYCRALVTVGQIKNPDTRIRLFALAQQFGCELPVVISPRAYVSRHAKIGRGTIVLHGAVINAGAEVGDNCIVNTSAVIDHDAIVGSHCHISTTAVLNAGVKVGAGTFVGSNTSIRQNLEIGSCCVIGMGQVVTACCVDGTQLPSVGAGELCA